MACGICNDAVAREKFDIFDIHYADLTRSAEKCHICAILQSALIEQGFDHQRDELRISNDTNDHSSRCTNGIHILVSKNGKGYTTDSFVMRNLKGKCAQIRSKANTVDVTSRPRWRTTSKGT